MKDTVTKLTGRVNITQRNVVTGQMISQGSNLVVNGLYLQLCYLLSGDLTNRSINKIEFGTGAGAAAVTDVGVTHLSPVVTVPVVVTYPTNTSVTFTATWDSAVTNAANITEVGLLFGNNVLAARWVFEAMKKSAGWEWVIEWTLSFA